MENLKILHIINDEKFISYCKATFVTDNIENTFAKSEDFDSTANTSNFHFIIIHYLSTNSAKVLNNNQFNIPIIWFLWGGDGFLLGKFSNSFLFPKTKLLLLKQAFREGFGNGAKTLLKFIIPTWADNLQNNREVIQSFDKINVVVPVMPGDYHLMKQQYDLKAPMFHLNYVNPVLNEFQSTFISGNNILLGNSASYTNNHLEIIDLLSKIDLGNRRIIIPLSYGNSKYAIYINDYAKQKLGERALCMLDFIPIIEYFEILENCGIVIMNHLRQQAVGNIVPMLAKGAHIYLQTESSLYKFLNEKGFMLSSIGDMKIIRELTREEKLRNKELTIAHFGKETQHKKVETLLKTLLQN